MKRDWPRAPKGSALAAFFEALKNAQAEYGGAIRRSSGGTFTCPVHEDTNPSLDVAVGTKQPILVNCKPCEAVYTPKEYAYRLCQVLGISSLGTALGNRAETSDVYWGERYVAPDTSGGSGPAIAPNDERWEPVATYYYRHADGTTNFWVTRREVWVDNEEGETGQTLVRLAREIRPFAMVDGSPEMGLPRGIVRTPYYLENFEAWRNGDGLIYLVEGEKDADRLVAEGYAATTFAGGSSGPLSEGWEHYFRDFVVVLVADRDRAGIARARRLNRELKAAGVTVRVRVAAVDQPKADVSDHLDADLDLSALVPLTGDLAKIIEAGTPLPVEPEETLDPDEQPPPDLTDYWPPPMAYTDIATKFIEVQRTHKRSGKPTFKRWNRANYSWIEARNRWEVRYNQEELDREIRRTIHEKPYKSGEETGSYNVTMRQIREITAALPAAEGVFRPDERATPHGLVSFTNGHLRIRDRKFLLPNPAIFNTVALPIPYDADTEDSVPTTWLEFLDSIGWPAGSEEHRALRMWFGYVLSGATHHQKALLIVGPTRSGKGVIARTLTALVGADNVSAPTISQVADRFGLASSIGKSLAIIGDARFKLRPDVMSAFIERFLSITGEDLQTIDVKNKAHWNGRLSSRFMITTNELPRFIEASNALAERFIVMTTTESKLGNEIIDLEDRLAAELPGILRWALVGLDDLEKIGQLLQPASGLASKKEILLAGSSVRQFAEECLVEDIAGNVGTTELYDSYSAWTKSQNMFVVDARAFGRELRTVFPSVERRTKGTSKYGKRYVYTGVRDVS